MVIDKEFHSSNRQNIAKKLDGGLAILTAYSAVQRGNDASFQFEQEANFWYLTGIEAPDWWVIIDGTQDKSWLVRPGVSESHQVFDGSLSSDEAIKISGIDTVLANDEATQLLKEMTKKHKTVYALGDHPHVGYFDFVVNPAQRKTWEMLSSIFDNVQECRLDLARLRAIKQPAEIESIKKAIGLTIDAFNEIRTKLPEYNYEYEVEAEFSYYFRKHGAIGHAYDPIVAGGKNACTLHYNSNNDVLNPKGLLLLDIGARVDGYAADITRTYSLGEPTVRATQIHLEVEKAHKKIISLLKPDLSVRDYQNQVEIIMKQALVGLGLMASINDNDDYSRYFPHAISHGLGVDVHDSLGSPEVLLPGMVLTVEPGIYIPEEAIGVRIEDDILITETGHENLSERLQTSL